jgi:cell wall-associated NlpC family hydrolase
MLSHGKLVVHEENARVGDLVIYGHGFPGEHVAMFIGGGKVFSHGSEAGPFKLDMDYRPDRMQIRRYI